MLASTYAPYNRSLKVHIDVKCSIILSIMCSTHLVEAFLSEGWPIALLQIAWAPRVNKHLILDKQATRAAMWSSSQLYIINNLIETFSISASDGDRISPCSSRMASMYPQRSGSVRSRPSSKPAINLNMYYGIGNTMSEIREKCVIVVLTSTEPTTTATLSSCKIKIGAAKSLFSRIIAIKTIIDWVSRFKVWFESIPLKNLIAFIWIYKPNIR